MKYRVKINKSYTVASFTFDAMTDASGFAQMAADNIDADDEKFSISIELIEEDKDEQL